MGRRVLPTTFFLAVVVAEGMVFAPPVNCVTSTGEEREKERNYASIVIIEMWRCESLIVYDLGRIQF